MPARWVASAKNITSEQDQWSEYLSIDQFADRIGQHQETIRSSLHREYSPGDPKSVISRPDAYIGRGRVGHIPMWSKAQVEQVRKLQESWAEAKRARRENDTLPTVSVAQAAERGLVTMAELVTATEVPKSTLSNWIRQYTAEHPTMPFPQKVAYAERVPPMQMGPPRPLYDLAAVNAWIARYDASSRAAG